MDWGADMPERGGGGGKGVIVKGTKGGMARGAKGEGGGQWGDGQKGKRGMGRGAKGDVNRG